MLDTLNKAHFPEDNIPVGIYIHVPFCRSRCCYCGFTSTLHDPALEEDYIRAVIREMDLWRDGLAALIPHGDVKADSIYFGGGTPSVLSVHHIAMLLEKCFSSFSMAGEPEITLEVNPVTRSTVDAEALLAAGVNRVSLGVQSLDDDVLRLMGRPHSAQDALRTLAAFRDAGCDNISVDIMAGFPGQSRECVTKTTRELLSLEPEHLSVYLLEVKQGTPLEMSLKNGHVQKPDDDLAADMYEDVRHIAQLAGYEQYEIANYARYGRVSRHNMKYWTDAVYLGLGPAAHGMTGRHRYANVAGIGQYCARAACGRLPFESVEDLTPSGRFRDALIMGLRLVRGVNLRTLSTGYGVDALRYVEETVGDLKRANLYCLDGDTLRLTTKGHLLSNIVFSRWV